MSDQENVPTTSKSPQLRERISNELLRYYGEPLILDAVRDIAKILTSEIDKAVVAARRQDYQEFVGMSKVYQTQANNTIAHFEYRLAQLDKQGAE